MLGALREVTLTDELVFLGRHLDQVCHVLLLQNLHLLLLVLLLAHSLDLLDKLLLAELRKLIACHVHVLRKRIACDVRVLRYRIACHMLNWIA